MKKKLWLIAIMLALSTAGARADDAAVAQRLEALQKEIESLKGEVAASRAAQGANAGTPLEFENAARRAEAQRTAIGGYGEIVYNNFRESGAKDQADLKRFVLFFGHRFDDRLKLYSEVEIEHAFAKNGVDPAQGELEMEQAYIEWSLADQTNLRTGLMIVPSGIINEYHEPPVFYGVERNEIETRIIPTTWRELGIALQGNAFGGLEYNVGISTTPDATQFNDATRGFRDMRTAGSKAPAKDLGFFAALNYRGMPGLLLGGSVFSGNTGHDGEGASTTVAALNGVNVKLTLTEIHGRYSFAGLDLRALYARGTLGDTAQLNAARSIAAGSGKAAPEEFYGWYTEAAYHVYKRGDTDIAPFLRFERYNTQKKVAAGFATDPKNDEKVVTIGVNFWVHPQVVFKVDVQNFDKDNLKDRFNLGVGYMF